MNGAKTIKIHTSIRLIAFKMRLKFWKFPSNIFCALLLFSTLTILCMVYFIDILRSDFSPSLTSICVKNPQECVPPLVMFEKRFRVVPQFKLNFCVIEKDMSTVMTAIACFLFNEQKFRKNGKHINNETFHKRFCRRKNEASSMDGLARKFNVTGGLAGLEQHWLHLAVVRDPIDRFISAFADKCMTEKSWRYDPKRCNGCHNNMTCFLERQLNRMQRRARGHERLNSFDDRHFNPQNWRCHFNEYFRFFTFLRYSTDDEGSARFFTALFNLLASAGVPEASIRFIRNQTAQGRAPHATHGSSARQRASALLHERPQLMEMLVKMYYYDFVLFGYPLPDIG